MRSLALDLSTTTGWAVGDSRPGSRIDYGRWILERRPSNIPRDLQTGYRMRQLYGAVDDAISVHQVDMVIVEAPLHLADGTSRLLGNLAGVVAMVCDERSVRYEEEHLSKIRKLVLGSARSENFGGKAGIMRWARTQGWDPVDDNVADALVLLRYRHLLDRDRVRYERSRDVPAAAG